MSLKYYAEERSRYGEMGSITVETALVALEKANHRFNLPRVKVVVKTCRRSRSVYRPGLNMYRPDGHLAKPMDIPTIEFAPNMLNWLTFLHELGHHIHCVRFNDSVSKRATADGINILDTTKNGRFEYGFWAIKNKVARQHWHGPVHRKIVQNLVDFFMELGMIPVKPTYVVRAELLRTAAVPQPIEKAA